MGFDRNFDNVVDVVDISWLFGEYLVMIIFVNLVEGCLILYFDNGL